MTERASDDDLKLDFWQGFENVAAAIAGEPSDRVLQILGSFAAWMHRFRYHEHPEFFEERHIKGPRHEFSSWEEFMRIDSLPGPGNTDKFIDGPQFDFAMFAAAHLIENLHTELLKKLDARMASAPEGTA
jgi:hypothetical protein